MISKAVLKPVGLLCLAWMSGAAVATDCVGVIPGGGSSAYWNLVRDGALEAGKEHQVNVYFRGPAREADSVAQQQVIDRVVAQGCRALVIAPAGKSIGARAARLREQGIQTLYIDRDMGGDAVLTVLATDNYQAGQQAGRVMARALGHKGRVVLFRLSGDVLSTVQREEGFLQAARAGGLTVDDEGFIGADSPQMKHVFEQAGQHYYAGLFTPDATTTTAAYVALKRLKWLGQQVHVGFDSSDLLAGALARGEIHALVLQQAWQMGYQGVTQAVQAMQGKLPPQPRSQGLPVQIATTDNLQQPQVRVLLGYPPLP